MALIACWFAQHRAEEGEESPKSIGSSSSSNTSPRQHVNNTKILLDALQRLPSSFNSVLRPKQHSVILQVEKGLSRVDQVVIFGQDRAAPVAHEGVMKLKELGQVHDRSWCIVEEDIPHVLMHRSSN